MPVCMHEFMQACMYVCVHAYIYGFMMADLQHTVYRYNFICIQTHVCRQTAQHNVA